MKCQHCGNHEASYHYRSNINGEITEQHLCAECARTMEGSVFTNAVARPMQDFEGFFSRPVSGSLFGGSLFANSGWMDEMARSFFFQPMALENAQATPQAEPAPAVRPEPKEREIPGDAGSELRQRRQINQLRREMKAAVRSENFERAAELRDEIYRLEKKD